MGRLDRDTEGLLILTNDGALAQLLTHPSHGVPKEYVAEVAGGTPPAGALRPLRQGVELEDGRTAPAEIGVLAPGELRLVIHEGRNRQVRRMCEAVGHPVVAPGAHPHRQCATPPGPRAVALAQRRRGAGLGRLGRARRTPGGRPSLSGPLTRAAGAGPVE